MDASDPTHVHVYNLCKCGQMWLSIDGTSPHGPGGGGGGALGGPKSAARVQAVRGAAMTKRDKKTAKKFKEADARRTAGLAAASAQIAEASAVTAEFSAELTSAMGALEGLEEAQKNHVKRTLLKLNAEAAKISKKDDVIRDLDERLKRAERGQLEILCGIRTYKLLCVAVLLLVIASIVMGVVGKFGAA
mmetsp:Transcript_18656/g.65924  ORF Transcript_18656/g.65924 Transcript_18656/m.65924 type:complete len:190 (-) Transcript_18656:72-641(-)